MVISELCKNKKQMKPLYTLLLICLISTSTFAQLKTFVMQAQVVDQNNNPIAEVDSVNLNSQEKERFIAWEKGATNVSSI